MQQICEAENLKAHPASLKCHVASCGYLFYLCTQLIICTGEDSCFHSSTSDHYSICVNDGFSSYVILEWFKMTPLLWIHENFVVVVEASLKLTFWYSSTVGGNFRTVWGWYYAVLAKESHFNTSDVILLFDKTLGPDFKVCTCLLFFLFYFFLYL